MLIRIIGAQQQQDFNLERVGVLELVNEYVREALLQLRTNCSMIANHVACEKQQIHEIEPTGLPFELLKAIDHGL